jgi:hypothetical protein
MWNPVDNELTKTGCREVQIGIAYHERSNALGDVSSTEKMSFVKAARGLGREFPMAFLPTTSSVFRTPDAGAVVQRPDKGLPTGEQIAGITPGGTGLIMLAGASMDAKRPWLFP